jgi:hypothetical protein
LTRLLRALACGALAVGVLLGASSLARAHDRGTSYSTWVIRDATVHVSVRLTELDLSRYPWGSTPGAGRDDMLRRYLPANLVLARGDRVCEVAGEVRSLRSAPGHVTWEWPLRCSGTGRYEIRSSLLADVSPSHLHFARARVGDGAANEKVLSSRGPNWRFAGPGSTADDDPGTSLAGYFVLGVEHIITGYDHLAFVLALLLLGSSLAEVAKIVTGFTVAHSLTLGLMVLGYVRPEATPIEALIGLSIALVAAENLWQTAGNHRVVPWLCSAALALMAVAAGFGYGAVSALTLGGLALFTFCYFRLFETLDAPGTLRWGIAFLFGLIHGFGFAAMLNEAGLPADRIVAALLGFNLGVEAGQLAVVSLVWPLLVLLRRRGPTWHIVVAEGGSAAVLALGLYWFVTRTYG